MRRAALVLHRADQGTRQREVLRPVRDLRRRERRHADRRCGDQLGGADPLLHGRDPREHGAPPGAGDRRPLRRDGRIPLLRGSRSRLGVAGTPAAPPRKSLPPHVRDPRQHGPDRGADREPDRSRGRPRPQRRPPSSPRLQLPRDPAPRDRRGPARLGPPTDLHRPLHPTRCGRPGPRPHLGQDHRQRGEARPGLRHRWISLRLALRQGREALPRLRDRTAPRRAAAEVPLARRAARPARPAQGDLWNRHFGRRGERPHPNRPLHRTVEVRRRKGRDPLGPRLQADRGARRPPRVRHAGQRRLPGTRARDRESAGSGEGGHQGRKSKEEGQEEAAAEGRRVVVAGDLRAVDGEAAGDTSVAVQAVARDSGRPPPARRGPVAPRLWLPRADRARRRELGVAGSQETPATRCGGAVSILASGRGGPHRTWAARASAGRRRSPTRLQPPPHALALPDRRGRRPRSGDRRLRPGRAVLCRGDPRESARPAPGPGPSAEVRARRRAESRTRAL